MTRDQIIARWPQASESFIKQNLGDGVVTPQFNPLTKALKAIASLELVKPVLAMEQSTDESKLNKTERSFLSWIRCQNVDWYSIQGVTLKLGDTCRYTVDFPVLKNGKLRMFEVKGGFFRDDAKVKIKVAARMYPWAQFVLVFKDSTKPSGWRFEPVNP